MAIDFSTFCQEQVAVVPVVNNKCVFNRKTYTVAAPNGWWQCSFKHNVATPIQLTDPSLYTDIPYKPITGYLYKNQFMFKSFEHARRNYQNRILVPVCFAENIGAFTSIKVVEWSNHIFFYHSTDYADTKIYEIESLFNARQPINNVKGVTPELRALYNFYAIEREASELALAEAQRKLKAKELLESFEGRLVQAFTLTGAQIINYVDRGDRVEVNWTYNGSDYEFNSVLAKDTLSVIDAGYCMSGADREHHASSLVLLAKNYEDAGLIHKTRR